MVNSRLPSILSGSQPLAFFARFGITAQQSGDGFRAGADQVLANFEMDFLQ